MNSQHDHSDVSQTNVRPALRLLEQADQFERMADRTAPEWREDFHRKTHACLSTAIADYSEQFRVESVIAHEPLTVAVTHVPSCKVVHLQPNMLHRKAQLVLRYLAKASGIRYYAFGPAAPTRGETGRHRLRA